MHLTQNFTGRVEMNVMAPQDAVLHKPPRIGLLEPGALNSITDIAGVQVGQITLSAGDVQTGVTVITAHEGDHYRQKVPAGLAVLNGFGKSVGLIQLQELGQLETPIALTNTFSVSAVAQAQIRDCIANNPEVGRGWPTVNPLVLECNDGFLNDIQRMAVSENDYREARSRLSREVEQGSVGAGRGMSCFQLKGGIGTASRKAVLASGANFTVGAAVLANFGLLPHLRWNGRTPGQRIAELLDGAARAEGSSVEKGSIIVVLATDAPLDGRQLNRLALRAGAGLARVGSSYGHGSGDIALAFSTGYQLPLHPQIPATFYQPVQEMCLDGLFYAAAESVEQAIVNALWYAQPVTGRNGHHRYSLRELLEQLHSEAVLG